MKSHFALLIAFLALVTATSSADTSCISGCTCKHRVDAKGENALIVSNCTLNISKNNFKTFKHVIGTMIFDNVIITNIDQDALSDFKNLRNFLVENSAVMKIASTAFDLPNIDVLKFSSTRFVSTPIITSVQLGTLIFEDCGLKEIPNLDNLPFLNILKLDNNSISEIPENIFAKAESLQDLTLANNSISNLSLRVFANNTELDTLHLDNNPLESLQVDFKTNLEVLSLKSCKLTTFDTNNNLELLNQLDLSNNQISILHLDAFDQMSELSYIDLSNNKLIELDDNIFEDCENLEKVVLDGNKLEKLPKFQKAGHTFSAMSYFSCNNCSLQSINGAFDKMPGLVFINLADNELSNIDGVFDLVRHLKKLDLSNNKLTTIRYNAFAKTGSLSNLDLSGNPLKPLDPLVLTNLGLLTKLDMSNTGLGQLWDNHNAVLKSVEELMIGKNLLKTITVEDLEVTPSIKLLDIERNQLECNEDLKKSITWLMTKKVYPIQGADSLKQRESGLIDTITTTVFNRNISWKTFAYETCKNKGISLAEDEFNVEKNTLEHTDLTEELTNPLPTATSDYQEYYDDDFHYDDDLDNKLINGEIDDDILMDDDKDGGELDVLFGERILQTDDDDIDNGSNLTRDSHILLITTVFIVTALAVLAVAVTTILLILKKNGGFNVQNGNMPRFKLPMWQVFVVPTQKKHSGSVYKPLSEDLSGPKTPMINRYEFKSTPQVHISIP